MMNGWNIASWLFQVVLTTGAASVVLLGLIPTKIGDKLLGYHFERKLTEFKTSQNEKLEQLKEQLAHLSDRGKHSNEREFNAISAVWDKFVDAFLSTNACVIMYMRHPEFSNMSQEELTTFLETTELSEIQKSTIKKASDKNKSYSTNELSRHWARRGRYI